MNRPKKESLLHGAAALAFAGIIVKVIGAFYKIPLGAMLGPVGMANFSIAYNIYSLLFVVATAGVPIAVSKMIAEAYAARDIYGAERIYSVSVRLFALIGFAGFIVLFFFASPLSELMGSHDAAYAIRAISPAVFFVSLSAVNRGYFQGGSDMYPTAVSEIAEASGKLVFGLVAAYVLERRGADISIVAAGAVSGVAAGSFLSCLYFSFRKKKGSRGKKTISARAVIKKLLSVSVPVTLGAAVMSLSAVIDSALVLNLLQKTGFGEIRAKWLFGAYNYATTLFSLPTAVFATFAAALVPSLAECRARKDFFEAEKVMNSGLRLSVLFAALCSSGMSALSYGIISLLYGGGIDAECISASAHLLGVVSLGTVPLAIVTATNAVHQAMGRAHIPVISISCGAAIKIFSNYILVMMPQVNIAGAAISTVLCYMTAMFINLLTLKKYGGMSPDLKNSVIKPVITGGAVFAAASAVYAKSLPLFGVRVSTVIAIFAGALVGTLLAFFLGNITKYDKKLLFGRKKIFKFIENN